MLKYRNVTIARGDNVLMENVNLSISEGEFVYVIGKVGVGKSSLLRTIYSDIDIASGDEARVFGQYDLLHLRSSQVPYLRRKIGIIFQDFQLLTDRTVYDNLNFVLLATGWKLVTSRRKRIAEVLDMVGMPDCGNRMPNTLSGGEQQRVVMARALLNNPRLILADEPTGNLDPETGRNIVGLLHDICRQQRATVIMATHNLRFLDIYPGRVLHLREKQLVEVVGSQDPDLIHAVVYPAMQQKTVAPQETPTAAES